jgi:general secretion pathway protein K
VTECDQDQREKATHGFALIVVVWFLVLIGAMGTILIVNGRAETAIARNIRAAANAEALADAGIARAIFNQTDPVSANRWKLDGAEHRVTMPAGTVSIRLQDETQKINPNLASETLLAALFKVMGVDGATARHLGAAVADWVSKDGLPRQFGAKLDQYRAAGRSYGPPNAPIRNLDELGLVLGMTPALLSSARSYLTIHTQTAEPNVRFAPQVIQRAVALAKRGSPDDSQEAPDAKAGDTQQVPVEERLIAVQVVARGRDAGVFVRYGVLRLDPENPKGYTVLDWQRDVLDDSATDRISG